MASCTPCIVNCCTVDLMSDCRGRVVSACIGLAVIGLFLAVTVIMFVVYRMRKKDEGSYALDEPKTSPTIGYTKTHDREFFA